MCKQYSSFNKIRRKIAHCLRFKNNVKQPKGQKITGPLTVEELHIALITIVQMLQRQTLPDDICNLQQHKCVSSRSKLKCLQPFIDEDNVIRVGGRLHNSCLLYNQKHPNILPKHKLTNLLAEHIHKSNLHSGPQQLLAEIRQNYWPLNGKNLAKKIS